MSCLFENLQVRESIVRTIQRLRSIPNVARWNALRLYRAFSVCGDRYSAEWVASAFEKYGVQYKASERSRSEIYLEVLPMFTAGTVELLDSRKLITQFAGLERRTSRGSRDTVDHTVGAHDDLCNAASGALVMAAASGAGELGLIEFYKHAAAGEFRWPASDSPVEATRPCPRAGCDGTMFGRADNVDFYTCEKCGDCHLISRNAQTPTTRKDFLEQQSEEREAFRGVFGRFAK
jgi:hypothetical protein